MDGFWCSRCLNDRVEVLYMIRLFAGGANFGILLSLIFITNRTESSWLLNTASSMSLLLFQNQFLFITRFCCALSSACLCTLRQFDACPTCNSFWSDETNLIQTLKAKLRNDEWHTIVWNVKVSRLLMESYQSNCVKRMDLKSQDKTAQEDVIDSITELTISFSENIWQTPNACIWYYLMNDCDM